MSFLSKLKEKFSRKEDSGQYLSGFKKTKTSFTEKIVTVGYLSPSTSWADTGEKTVSKYMDYIFEKQDGQFCLVAVRESSMKVELPQTSEVTE